MGQVEQDRPAFPSGMLTFLISAIEGSTLRWKRYGDDTAAGVARFVELLGAAVDEAGGRLVSSTSDTTIAVFEAAAPALSAALETQSALQRENWGGLPEIRVRMGLHTGWAEPVGAEYCGPVLTRADRVADAGHGRQVVVSASTARLLDESRGVELRSRGVHRLRDLTEPIELFQVVSDAVDGDELPLRTVTVDVREVPIQRTSFHGRDDEVAQISRLLESNRLVTLTGTGGVGKTRLALHAAAELSARFAAGVRVVDLSSARPGPDVPSSIQARLARTDEDEARVGPDPLDSLIRWVGDRELLLVLDNCERVLDDVSVVCDALLGSCGNVRVLATSRERLRAPGEHVLRVEPFRFTPDATPLGDPAVRLFVERSIAHGGPNPSKRELAHIARICGLVDRLPLGIELAAARATHMPLAELASRLEAQHQILVTRDPTASQRHRTVDQLLRWSRDMLEDAERLLFDRLSIFEQPVGIEAIEHVCTGTGVERGTVLDLLGSLVDRNLVVQDQDSGRYHLLNLVRGFAATALDADRPRLERRHCEWCLDLLDEASKSENEAAFLEIAEGLLPDVTAALGRAHALGDAEASRRIAGGVWRCYEMSGRHREGVALLAPVLDMEEDRLDADWATAAGGVANLLMTVGETTRAALLHQRAVGVFGAIGDESAEAWGRTDLSMAILPQDAVASEAHARKSLAVFERIGDRRGAGHAHSSLGFVASRAGLHDQAERHYLEALNLFRFARERRDAAAVLSNLGNLAQDRGDLRRALRYFDGAVQLYREIDDRRGQALITSNLSLVAEHLGDNVRARALAEDALILFEALGDGQGAAAVQLNLANLTAEAGERGRALRLYQDSIENFRRSREVRGVLLGLENLSQVAWSWGERRLGWRCELDKATVQLRLGLDAGLAASLSCLADRSRELGGTHLDLARRFDRAAEDPRLEVERLLMEARAADPSDATESVPSSSVPADLAELTARELELLALVGRGFTNREIASELFISPRTVDAHLSHIRTKLGVSDRVKLAVLAREL